MKQPALSVIIPARNEDGYIGPCLESLNDVATEVEGLEVIVVDNGSDDDTVRIAKSQGAQVLHVPAGSLGKLRNEGARTARGQWLGFIDADCTVDTGWATAATELLRDGAVATGSYPKLPEGQNTWVQIVWSYIARKDNPRPQRVSWLPTANLVVERNAFWTLNGFDESLMTAEDADMGYRLSKVGLVLYSDTVSARHHREPKTLGQFFQKEIWHGLGTYQGLASGRFTWAELPSLATPLVTWFSWLLIALGIVDALAEGETGRLLTALSVFAFIPTVYTIRKRAGTTPPPTVSVPAVWLLFCIYHSARAISLLQWVRTRIPTPSLSARMSINRD